MFKRKRYEEDGTVIKDTEQHTKGRQRDRHVIIRASEVAACIGRNRFKPVSDVLVEKWKQWFPKDYREFVKKHQPKHQPLSLDILAVRQSKQVQDKANEIAQLKVEQQQLQTQLVNLEKPLLWDSEEEKRTTIEQASHLRHKLESVKEEQTEKSKGLQTQITQELKNLGHEIDNKQTEKAIESCVTSTIACQVGVKEETKAVALHEKKYQAPIQERSNRRPYLKTVGTFVGPSGETIIVDIWGYVDGVSADGLKIVEVKNRQSRLFYRMVDYERIQVMTYMWLTGIWDCHFIERFHDKHKEYELKFNEQEWNNELLSEITAFIQQVIVCVTDEEWKKSVIDCGGPTMPCLQRHQGPHQ